MKVDINQAVKNLEGEYIRKFNKITPEELRGILSNLKEAEVKDADLEVLRNTIKTILTAIDETANRMTLKEVCVEALLASQEKDGSLTGEKKFQLFKLATQIHDSGEFVNLSSEEITLLKTRIANSFNTLVTGQSYQLLDPAEDGKDGKNE